MASPSPMQSRRPKIESRAVARVLILVAVLGLGACGESTPAISSSSANLADAPIAIAPVAMKMVEVSGRVVDAEGQARAGIQVEGILPGEGEFSAWTDEQGHYHASLSVAEVRNAGVLRLIAYGEDGTFASRSERFRIEDDEAAVIEFKRPIDFSTSAAATLDVCLAAALEEGQSLAIFEGAERVSPRAGRKGDELVRLIWDGRVASGSWEEVTGVRRKSRTATRVGAAVTVRIVDARGVVDEEVLNVHHIDRSLGSETEPGLDPKLGRALRLQLFDESTLAPLAERQIRLAKPAVLLWSDRDGRVDLTLPRGVRSVEVAVEGFRTTTPIEISEPRPGIADPVDAKVYLARRSWRAPLAKEGPRPRAGQLLAPSRVAKWSSASPSPRLFVGPEGVELRGDIPLGFRAVFLFPEDGCGLQVSTDEADPREVRFEHLRRFQIVARGEKGQSFEGRLVTLRTSSERALAFRGRLDPRGRASFQAWGERFRVMGEGFYCEPVTASAGGEITIFSRRALGEFDGEITQKVQERIKRDGLQKITPRPEGR